MELCCFDSCLVVVRNAHVFVPPARSYTSNLVLPISPINILHASGEKSATIHHHPHLLAFEAHPKNQEQLKYPFKMLQQSLAEILVPYFPLAGRIRTNERTGELEVHCNGAGVMFYEAHSTATLQELKTLEKTCWEQLLCELIPSDFTSYSDTPPLIVQVTHLDCGGFIVGIRIFHGLCDAAGILQFLNGWATIACKIEEGVSLPVFPLWPGVDFPSPKTPPKRVHIPSLNLIFKTKETVQLHSGPDFHNAHELVPATQLQIFHETVVSLRREVAKSGLTKCNSFEVLAAYLWRERTRALDVKNPDQEMKLFFLADDQGTKQDLPIAYYGLYAFNCEAILRAGKLQGSTSLKEAVEAIQEAKSRVEKSFTRCYGDFVEAHCACGYGKVEAVVIMELWKMKNIGMDFGWGEPMHLHGLRLPPHVNLICVDRPSYAYDCLHVTLTNLPPSSLPKLKALPSHIPLECCSKM